MTSEQVSALYGFFGAIGALIPFGLLIYYMVANLPEPSPRNLENPTDL